jgi:hypothetical protein
MIEKFVLLNIVDENNTLINILRVLKQFSIHKKFVSTCRFKL